MFTLRGTLEPSISCENCGKQKAKRITIQEEKPGIDTAWHFLELICENGWWAENGELNRVFCPKCGEAKNES